VIEFLLVLVDLFHCRTRKLEKKQYQRDMKKQKRQANDLPFSNPDLREDVDFGELTLKQTFDLFV